MSGTTTTTCTCFTYHVSCIIIYIVHCFTYHISYIYSCQAPLGVTLKSETSYEDMVCVMDELHQYVPTISTTLTVDVNDTEQAEVIIDDFHPRLAGGDMLTTARARGSQRVRKCGHRPKDRLEGILPVCEDWHCKVVLLGVRVHPHTQVVLLFCTSLSSGPMGQPH